MKRLLSIILAVSVILSVTCIGVSANDYREFSIEDLKPQWPIKTNRDFYLTAVDYYKSGSKHNGIDIGHNGGSTEESRGEYIYPVEDGVVSACGWDDSMGWYVKVTHTVNGKKYYSRYMHFLKDSIPSNIKKGASVYRDTPIGRMGNTGNSDGTHLHFDIANTDSGTYEQLSKIRGYTFDYYINNPSVLKRVKFSGSWSSKNGSKKSCYWSWILENSIKDGDDYLIHICSKYETYGNVLGACKECHRKFDYSKIYTGDVAGLWIAKKNQNINLYSEPYEDATYTSVKSGELEVRGYVNNAYGNKWYVINGDKNKTYYVYENTFKNLYTQDSHYYENDYHRYDSGAVIEAPNTNNNGGNNSGLGNSIVGVVDIPSSWDNLSIRTGPSTNYRIIGSMNDGVRCNVYPSKTKNGWYYVEYNGIYGYASGKQINTNNSSTTATPSTPAGISLSTSNVNLDYPNSASQTITVTATGDLPNKYTFELNLSGNINFNWGSSWSGNSINLTLSANQNSNSTTGTIYLKDSNSNGVLASINFNVNVTKPIVNEYITVYFDTTGSSTSFASQTVEKYGTLTTPYREPNRTGYTFLGWSSNLGVTIGQYSANETISVGENDLVLYAIWQKDKADWSEWDLSLSKYDLYFEDHDKEKTVIIKVDKQDDSEFYFTLEFDENIDITLGDEYYNEHGIFCTEVIVSAPQKSLSNEKVTIRMRDENHEIVDSTSFYVYREEETELFPDRNPSGISVYLNGKKLSFDVQPQIINSRTMVPMRKIFEELGTVVGWNNNTQRAISVKKGDVVSVSIGGQYLTVNGEQKLLDSPPVIISGRTLVPVRAVAESFNCDVEWYDYGASQVVDINMKDTINSMENIGSLLIGYSEFPPFSYYDDYGNLIGFDTELAKYVCDFWGWDCSFVEIPFDMKFVAINSGQIDCYWNGVTKTEERAEICTFSNEYVSFDMEYEEDGEWYTSHEVYSVPFRKGDYDTVQLVNIALEEAQKDGTIEYLKYKYGIE